MAALATVDDYTARFGAPADVQRVERLLGDASSMVREVAGLTISRVDDDEITVSPGGTSEAIVLPEFPVLAVSTIAVDGTPVPTTDWRWAPSGIVTRCCGSWSTAPVTVTYSHGYDPVPDWIAALVCAMAYESTGALGRGGEQTIATGGQSVTYVQSRAGLYIPPADLGRVLALRGPTIV